MANRRFTQFLWNPHTMPVLLDCSVAIGATGAVGTVKGTMIKGVTRLATGVYRIQLQDNYYKFYLSGWSFRAPVTGSAVPDGSLSAGTMYEIQTVGTTDWNAAGLPTGLTAAVGSVFKAANVGGSGSGTAKALGFSGITSVEVLGDTNTMLGPQGVANQGGYITVKCNGPTNSSTTTPVATDPASGSVMFLSFYLSNSSVVVQGE